MVSNLRKRFEKRKGIDFKALRGARKQGGWDYGPKNKEDMVAVLTYKLGQVDHQIKYTKDGLNNQGYQELALKHLESIAGELEKSDLKEYQKQKFAGSIQRRAYRISNDPYVAKNHELDEMAIELVEEMEKKYGVKPHPALERSLSLIAVSGILGGIFFLSTNMTGNVIADLTTKTTSFLGAGLLVVGLVAGFFYIKSKKK